MKEKEVYAGINSQIEFNDFSADEINIVRKLATIWYVTRTDVVRLGNSRFSYALLKPTASLTATFNLRREVVALFSSYNNFEPRVFDVLDELNIQELRIEEICCLIISKDDNVSSIIRTILKSNTESRVLIPFTYRELLQEHIRDFLISRMRSEFFSRDLFGIQDALKKDLYFFGRKELIHEIVAKHESGENAGIFGLRKTGKTSILYGIERTLNRKSSHALFIDCQTLHNKPWNLALKYIIDETIKKVSISPKEVNKRERYIETSNASDAFYEDIMTILRIGKKNLLLIFDEIENITFGTSASESWRNGDDYVKFWQSIRSAFQRKPQKHHFTYLIAGTNPRCIEEPTIRKIDNPIFQQIAPIYIPPFNVDQTLEMVDLLGGYMGLKFSKESCIHLMEDFGGHPLLMRQMCSYIHNNCRSKERPITIEKPDYEEYKRQFYIEQTGFTQYAKMILNVLSDWYKDEYEMLTFLAIGDTENFTTFSKDTTYIKHLLNYGIIANDNTSIGYHFKIEALRDYLLDVNKYKRLIISDEDKEKEILERRSSIEKKLRKLVKRQLKSILGEDNAKKEMIKYIYGPKEIGHKSNISYQDFFDPNKHKIYLKTLLDIISMNYKYFENLFNINKEVFTSKCELFNHYRRTDAHSAVISNSDFATFRGIASWFEDILIDE